MPSRSSGGSWWIYDPVLLDLTDPPLGARAGFLRPGDRVRVVSVEGCPRPAGHAFIEPPTGGSPGWSGTSRSSERASQHEHESDEAEVPARASGRHAGRPGGAGRGEQSPLEFLARHVVGDWGDVTTRKRANDFDLANGGRLLSAYTLSTGVKLWLITEADRSSTCSCSRRSIEHEDGCLPPLGPAGRVRRPGPPEVGHPGSRRCDGPGDRRLVHRRGHAGEHRLPRSAARGDLRTIISVAATS